MEVEKQEDANIDGEIWQAAWDAIDAGASDATTTAMANVNGGEGRGWGYRSLEVEVKNHKLLIGVTCDEAITGVPATLEYLSADDFNLVLKTKGDNSDWIIATDIEEMEAVNAPMIQVIDGRIISDQPIRIYSITGTEMNGNARLQEGIYIVRANSVAVKVLIK